jgi:hypothetical protein
MEQATFLATHAGVFDLPLIINGILCEPLAFEKTARFNHSFVVFHPELFLDLGCKQH